MEHAFDPKQRETAAHSKAVQGSVSEIAKFLQEVLTRRLTAYAVGVKDAKTVTRWANGEITEIRDPEVEKRLRATYQIVDLLLKVDGAETVRGWFLGMNPELDDDAPIDAIREGRLKDALGAARAYVVLAW
jgi:predicted exporter